MSINQAHTYQIATVLVSHTCKTARYLGQWSQYEGKLVQTFKKHRSACTKNIYKEAEVRQ